MEASKIFITYLLTVPVFFAIDMVWLGLVAKNFYNKHLGKLLTENVIWSAAIIFYLVYIAGILYFAVLPAVEKKSLSKAVINGALLGGLAYATYDLTNLATLKGWPFTIVWVDILWGMILTALVAAASYQIAMWVR